MRRFAAPSVNAGERKLRWPIRLHSTTQAPGGTWEKRKPPSLSDAVPSTRVESVRLRSTTLAFSSGARVDWSATVPVTVPSAAGCARRATGCTSSRPSRARAGHGFIRGTPVAIR